MAQIDEILRVAVERRVSDTHLSAGEHIWMRLHGDLERYGEQPFPHAELERMLLAILSEKEKERLKANKNLDKSYFIEGLGNFRVNIFYTRRGVGAVIRTLPSKMPEIDDLGLPSVIKSLAELPKGLILVTGPTGSGKSTTLAAIINYMNSNFGYHILTAEDPVEFIHQSKKSLINQREIGASCPTFADALKFALREDPDVILVGEMRDIETIGLAMTAAETGHLVLGTLHTRGAASTIDRIIESFPGVQQAMARAMLAESLAGVISQTLLKTPDGNGRVAVYEVMVMNWAISNLVREGKTFQIPSIMQTGKRDGMMLMENHARDLAAAGQITQADADALVAALGRGGQQNSKASVSSSPSMGLPTKSDGTPSSGAAPVTPAPTVKAGIPPTVPVKPPAPPVVAAPPPLAMPVPQIPPKPELPIRPQADELLDVEDSLIAMPEGDTGFTNLAELDLDLLEAPAPKTAPRKVEVPPAPPPKMPGSAPVAKTGPKPLPIPIKKTG